MAHTWLCCAGYCGDGGAIVTYSDLFRVLYRLRRTLVGDDALRISLLAALAWQEVRRG